MRANKSPNSYVVKATDRWVREYIYPPQPAEGTYIMSKNISCTMNKKLPLLIILCGIAISATGLVQAQNLTISDPTLEWTRDPDFPYTFLGASYDYGDVVLGESKTATFHLDSTASSEVSIYLITLDDTKRPEPPCAGYNVSGEPLLYCWESFCFNPDTYQLLPVVLPPGDYLLVDVTFTPISPGEQSVYLGIRCNDVYPPPGAIAYINLVGTGVSGPPPEEQIDDIQEFFDDSVTSGELAGVGATAWSAAGKLNALENMLEQAEYLIDIDDVEGACAQLHSAYEKTDGIMLPPDFVTGPAAEELATMIQDLMDSLGCE